jgi:CRISPR system Cascade subunit CasC
MSRFVQLHLLTSYPPANLNRDDTGRPKSALVGEALRLRISSQSLKRAWRTSEVFANFFDAPEKIIGTRTKRVGLEWIYSRLIADGVAEGDAKAWSQELQRTFGEPEKEKQDDPDAIFLNSQLVHISPVEKEKLAAFVRNLTKYLTHGTQDELVSRAERAIQKRDKASDKKKANAALARELAEILLVKESTASDIALFGRMLAAVPAYNFDAAVQVAHAFTVHKAAVEDDYFSAVDDLNTGLEDAGAGHIGERGYGAGLFYLYLCINREQLRENLGGDAALTERTLEALAHAIAKVSPTGMQNSFASRAYAVYALAEKGDQQPRSLAQAFLKPVRGGEDHDLFENSVRALTQRWENFDKVYGACADARYAFNVETGEGALAGLVDFIKGG